MYVFTTIMSKRLYDVICWADIMNYEWQHNLLSLNLLTHIVYCFMCSMMPVCQTQSILIHPIYPIWIRSFRSMRSLQYWSLPITYFIHDISVHAVPSLKSPLDTPLHHFTTVLKSPSYPHLWWLAWHILTAKNHHISWWNLHHVKSSHFITNTDVWIYRTLVYSQ